MGLWLILVAVQLVLSGMPAYAGDPNQYIYPIDTILHEGREQFLVLWQINSQHTQLYRWDPQTKTAEKELFSLYSPAGVQVLPSKSAYSFIDQGRVRVKACIKRSPGAIDFDLPIHDISLMHWIDDQTAYCHAREGHRFGIYVFTRQGDVECIAYDRSCDYLFPQEIADTFFCIQRYDACYAVCMISGIEHAPKAIISYGDHPIAFLRMESMHRGYVLVHQAVIEEDQKCVRFAYDMIEKSPDGWSKTTLFTFLVPRFLIDKRSEHALYENIMPLLPYHDESHIYYGSFDHDNHEINWFCMGSDEPCSIKKVSGVSMLLGPKKYKSELLFGGQLCQKNIDRHLSIDDDDRLDFSYALL